MILLCFSIGITSQYVGAPYHFKAKVRPWIYKSQCHIVLCMNVCCNYVTLCTGITNTHCCFVHHPRAVCQSLIKCCSAISSKYCSMILLFTVDLIIFSTETNLHKKCIYWLIKNVFFMFTFKALCGQNEEFWTWHKTTFKQQWITKQWFIVINITL